MKDWQHGFELDYLKSLEAKYAEYNAYTLSPFAKFKKNNIAESLFKGTLNILDDAMLEVVESKSASNITMHGDTVIAKKQKGDMTVSKLLGNLETIKKCLDYPTDMHGMPQRDIWLYVWAENKEHCQLAEDLNFCYVGPKITTYGEIYAIYYRGKQREFPKVDPAEFLSIKKVDNVNVSVIESIHSKLNLLPSFTNHYSNYNKDKSWSALSLRGYSSNPEFITKPIEMSDKWKEEHKDENFFMQDTQLFEQFEEVKELLKSYGSTLHRVRFMRLKPGGGELERHTDQVDPDSGGSKGKLARLHFPIKTNDKVEFTVWDVKGNAQKVHMKVGECWFLDTRKAHMAVNGGDEERIHLVVDIVTEDKLHAKLIDA
jgi:hypothetical protein